MKANKVQKIREEVERLKRWNNNVRNSTRHMTLQEEDFNRGKHSSYLEILNFIDSLQEEPVSEVWHDANEEQPEEYRTVVVWNPIIMDGEVLTRCAEVYKGRIWAYIEDLLNLSNLVRIGKNLKEEPVSMWHDASEEPKPNMELICVGQYGNPLVLSSNSDSFKERYISKWAYFNDLLNLSNAQRTTKDCKEPVSEDLEKASKKWLSPQLDKSYAAYGETKQMELTHFDGYAMLDAIEFGAQWQKAKDQSTIELAEDHAYFAGRTKTIEEIEEKLLLEVLPCFMHGGEADEVVAKLDEVLNQKK